MAEQSRDRQEPLEPGADGRSGTAARWAAVEALAAEGAAAGWFSGTVLVTVGGETVLEVCHGMADRAAGVPVHPGTRFALASVSKMFTAVAVLDAVRRGEAALHTPVADLLAADRRPVTLRPDVTVHHLLTHTSGIADYAEEDEDLPGYVEDYGSLWVDRPCYRMRDAVDFLPMFADRPPIGPPGERFRYSNAGYIVLGLVLEAVTGGRFTEVVTDRVLKPCGMWDSGYFALDEPRPDLATGYLTPARPGEPWRSNIYSTPVVGGPDGGAFSTTRDLDRFLVATEAGTVVGPQLRDLMLTPHIPVEEDISMGYGVYVRPGGRFTHDGGDPGVEAVARRNTALGASVVALGNIEGSLDRLWGPLIDALENA